MAAALQAAKGQPRDWNWNASRGLFPERINAAILNPSRQIPKFMSNEIPERERKKLKAKKYEKELRKLQAELCKLQEWVKHKGLRVIIVFEGRDAAGKGGTIRALTERVSPRVFRVVALPAPVRSREVADVYAALHAAFPGGGRDRHLRPQLVQPRSASNM